MEKDDVERWAEKGLNESDLQDSNSQFLNWAVYGVPQTYTVKDGKILPFTEKNISEGDYVVHRCKLPPIEILEKYKDILTEKEKELLRLKEE